MRGAGNSGLSATIALWPIDPRLWPIGEDTLCAEPDDDRDNDYDDD